MWRRYRAGQTRPAMRYWHKSADCRKRPSDADGVNWMRICRRLKALASGEAAADDLAPKKRRGVSADAIGYCRTTHGRGSDGEGEVAQLSAQGRAGSVDSERSWGEWPGHQPVAEGARLPLAAECKGMRGREPSRAGCSVYPHQRTARSAYSSWTANAQCGYQEEGTGR